MREILFRGKRVDNGEWVYGFYNRCEARLTYTEKYYKNNPRSWIQTIENDGFAGQLVHVDTDTVGQYTGLTDKNGTRIFEGDILKQKRYGISEDPFSVDWNAEGAGWYFIDVDGHTDELWQSICNSCTVVGNITDNPDMMTDKGEG